MAKKYPEDNSIVLTDSNGYRNVKDYFGMMIDYTQSIGKEMMKIYC